MLVPSGYEWADRQKNRTHGSESQKHAASWAAFSVSVSFSISLSGVYQANWHSTTNAHYNVSGKRGAKFIHSTIAKWRRSIARKSICRRLSYSLLYPSEISIFMSMQSLLVPRFLSSQNGQPNRRQAPISDQFWTVHLFISTGDRRGECVKWSPKGHEYQIPSTRHTKYEIQIGGWDGMGCGLDHRSAGSWSNTDSGDDRPRESQGELEIIQVEDHLHFEKK